MYDKTALIASLRHETKVIKHLATQVPATQLNWRPTDKQRSTIELLRFLTIAGIGSAEYLITGNWDHWGPMDEARKSVTVDTFAKAMDKQQKALEKILAGFSDAALKRKPAKTWSGAKTTLGTGFIEMVLKSMVAYRMQLFLYAKESGASHIATSDCWNGKPAKAKKASAG
ncbi:MAG: DinB family protein [Planctomycetes bacterium]|nr:DinB family protein [Planctomycetota bacterium]